LRALLSSRLVVAWRLGVQAHEDKEYEEEADGCEFHDGQSFEETLRALRRGGSVGRH
jgi:hypothetical protein